MNDSHDISRFEHRSAAVAVSTSEAKARLLSWADESDARSLKSRTSIASMATYGGLAILGGVTIARVLAPRRRLGTPGSRVASVGARLISWALVVRAGQFLLPYAISAAQTSLKRRASN